MSQKLQYCHLIPNHTIHAFMTLFDKAFENKVGKVENRFNQHFHLLLQCFQGEILALDHLYTVVCKCSSL